MSVQQPNDNTIQIEKAKAELLKLQLEIQSLEMKQKNNTNERIISKASLRKLILETRSLKRQNSLGGLVLQYMAVVTALATAVGIWIGILRFLDDRDKDRTLRDKELQESIDKQYRADLNELIQFGKNSKLTIPQAVFLIQDIDKLIKKGPHLAVSKEEKKAIQKKQESEVGYLLASLINSAEYDFPEARNIEFDRRALFECEYYSSFLLEHPVAHMEILTRYYQALDQLHTGENMIDFFKSVKIEQTGRFFTNKAVPDENAYAKFRDLVLGYKSHVRILQKNLQESPNDSVIQDYFNTVFCWFYSATRNESVTKNVFGDGIDLEKQLGYCN